MAIILLCCSWSRVRAVPGTWDSATCYNVALGGHLSVLQWARSEGCPWDRNTCSRAAFVGHLTMLQWPGGRTVHRIVLSALGPLVAVISLYCSVPGARAVPGISLPTLMCPWRSSLCAVVGQESGLSMG